MVFHPVASFSPAIFPRIFLDFPFSRKVSWEQVTTGAFSVSLSVPIENLNFEGMLALPLTPYATFKWVLDMAPRQVNEEHFPMSNEIGQGLEVLISKNSVSFSSAIHLAGAVFFPKDTKCSSRQTFCNSTANTS